MRAPRSHKSASTKRSHADPDASDARDTEGRDRDEAAIADARAEPRSARRRATVIADARRPLVIPVIDEEIEIEKREVPTGGVRLKRSVESIDKLIDVALRHDEVAVDRVDIGEIVERPPSVRREGDTLVIPVLEEIVVYEKRWKLVSEVRITRKRVTTRVRKHVPLRRDAVEIERLPSQEFARGSTGSRSGNAVNRDSAVGARAPVRRKRQARKS